MLNKDEVIIMSLIGKHQLSFDIIYIFTFIICRQLCIQ